MEFGELRPASVHIPGPCTHLPWFPVTCLKIHSFWWRSDWHWIGWVVAPACSLHFSRPSEILLRLRLFHSNDQLSDTSSVNQSPTCLRRYDITPLASKSPFLDHDASLELASSSWTAILLQSSPTITLDLVARTSKNADHSSDYRERTTAATRRAAATSSPSAAATARDALPRTRRSRDSPSATWLSLLPFV